ncbi:MarR family EPS-associated transcriptional regulator [Rubrivivax rivuli]|uniref:MarR family EPS-associated transcriptional regulator n=1 Tax=Rubrivivax rivuli TaxID=1862385 RepID=A0A437RBM6_9BURK|nr:MarR family EPS-associated transcriptional regulator [Rubrivivax rivuli]RVU44206.1 MarR family EPS-associated transcriptional regulator [Rubrivivax rivuli]
MNEQGPVEKTSVQESIGSSADAHLALLRLLERHPEYSQRELAAVLDVSLGKTHYLLKALLEKGWVKVNNFRRSGNKLAYAYLLTPAGLKAKIQLTRSFLSRREAEFERLQREIAELKQELSGRPDTP